MRKVGFIGWRGMVGSVLMERMRDENDFQGYEPVFFTTSQVGQDGPDVGAGVKPLEDAMHIERLTEMDVVVPMNVYLCIFKQGICLCKFLVHLHPR